MPKQKRLKTRYPGVFIVQTEGDEVFYIRYRKSILGPDGKMVNKAFEEPVGSAYHDDMTAARASRIRDEKISGARKSASEEREEVRGRVAYTLVDAFNDWAEWEPRKSEKLERNRLHRNFTEAELKRDVGLFVEEDAVRLRNRLLKVRELAPDTVRLGLAQMKMLLRFSASKKKKRPMPDFDFHLPKANRVRREDMGEDGMVRYLAVLNETIDGKHGTDPRRIRAAWICKFALATGLRAGSIFNLKWKHVHIERRWLDLVDMKSGELSTTLPINEVAMDVLLNQKRGGFEDFVFPGRDGRTRLNNIAHSTRLFREMAGLPKSFKPLHGLRNTAGATMVSSGVEMKAVSELFDHRSGVRTTERHYGHLRKGPVQQAANELARQIRLAEEAGGDTECIHMKAELIQRICALQPGKDVDVLRALLATLQERTGDVPANP